MKIIKKIINKGKILVLIHGRGSNAKDMINFVETNFHSINYVALEAKNGFWYPFPFMFPKQKNQPYLAESLNFIKKTIEDLKEENFQIQDIILMGFSQGACLASEYLARNSEDLGAVIIFSGGLIGEKIDPPKKFFEKTKIFISGSKNDPFIPIQRMQETSKIFKQAKAEATELFYHGNSHTITEKEIQLVKQIISKI